MKKLLLALLIFSLFPQVSLANNDTATCTFPTTKRKVTITIKDAIKDTTIDYQHCTTLNTATNVSECRTNITNSNEYKNAIKTLESDPSNKSAKDIRDKGENTIKQCETQLDEVKRLSSSQSAYTQTLTQSLSTTENCVTNDGNIRTEPATNPNDSRIQINCKISDTASQGLQTLQNVFTNQFVFQLIEPITDENLVIQKRTCTYEFLRNKDGLLQAVDSSQNKSDVTRDSNFYENNLFTITENACFVTYVESCTPNLVLDARLKISTPLPISTYCKTYQVISGSSGTGFIKGFVNIIYRVSVGIIGVIAVIVMVVNGIRISTAGDDSGAVSEAKERIAQSIFGLAVLFLAWIILRSVNPNFFTSNELTITDPRNTTTNSQTQTNTNNSTNNAN